MSSLIDVFLSEPALYVPAAVSALVFPVEFIRGLPRRLKAGDESPWATFYRAVAAGEVSGVRAVEAVILHEQEEIRSPSQLPCVSYCAASKGAAGNLHVTDSHGTRLSPKRSPDFLARRRDGLVFRVEFGRSDFIVPLAPDKKPDFEDSSQMEYWLTRGQPLVLFGEWVGADVDDGLVYRKSKEPQAALRPVNGRAFAKQRRKYIGAREIGNTFLTLMLPDHGEAKIVEYVYAESLDAFAKGDTDRYRANRWNRILWAFLIAGFKAFFAGLVVSLFTFWWFD